MEVERTPGSANVRVKAMSGPVWTGNIHLWLEKGSEFTFGVHDITYIATRSSDDEDDEPWVIYFNKRISDNYLKKRDVIEVLESLSRL